MPAWIEANDALLGWLFSLSLAMFLAAVVVVPVIVVRLPADYFAPPRRRPVPSTAHPLLRIAWRVAKNVLGGALVLAGLAMLLLPGQGILTILIGVSVMDFPGKYRLERRIIHGPAVLTSINALRKRFGRPPLEFGANDGYRSTN